jgi:hypothetical protein
VLGQVDRAHAAFAQDFDDLVVADAATDHVTQYYISPGGNPPKSAAGLEAGEFGRIVVVS